MNYYTTKVQQLFQSTKSKVIFFCNRAIAAPRHCPDCSTARVLPQQRWGQQHRVGARVRSYSGGHRCRATYGRMPYGKCTLAVRQVRRCRTEPAQHINNIVNRFVVNQHTSRTARPPLLLAIGANTHLIIMKETKWKKADSRAAQSCCHKVQSKCKGTTFSPHAAPPCCPFATVRAPQSQRATSTCGQHACPLRLLAPQVLSNFAAKCSTRRNKITN